MKKIVIFYLLSFHVWAAFAQVSQVYPEQPHRNDTLQISYQPNAPEAILKETETIFTRIVVFNNDGTFNRYALLLRKSDDKLKQYFLVPGQAAYIKVQFFTVNADDTNASKELLVYEKNKNVPVAGAYFEKFFTNNPEPVFKNEITHHPDNYLAFAKYFNVVSMMKDAEQAKAEIEKYLTPLETRYKKIKRNNAGLLSALCIGKAKTNNLSVGKRYLLELMQQFPESGETKFAYSLFTYEDYKAKGTSTLDADILNQARQIFIKYPTAPLSSESNLTYELAKDRTIPLTAFEQVLLPLHQNKQLEYYALCRLAEIYLERKQKLEEAKRIAEKALDEFMSGSINQQYRLETSHYQQYVPYYLLLLTKINFTQQTYREAINNASAAMQLVAGTNLESNLVPDLKLIRAGAHQRLGNLNKAMEDYMALYLTGNPAALDSVQSVYKSLSAGKMDFNTFLANWEKKVKSTVSKGEFKSAPEFVGTDIHGNKVSLSALKGKVVVLNFWSIGCGPCIVEMPELNKLVAAYQNKADVVFLAITPDDTERLQKFLQKKKFDYRIINNTDNAPQKYQVNAWPVHLIVDKQGNIVLQSVGAREKIATFLSQAINRQLQL